MLNDTPRRWLQRLSRRNPPACHAARLHKEGCIAPSLSSLINDVNLGVYCSGPFCAAAAAAARCLISSAFFPPPTPGGGAPRPRPVPPPLSAALAGSLFAGTGGSATGAPSVAGAAPASASCNVESAGFSTEVFGAEGGAVVADPEGAGFEIGAGKAPVPGLRARAPEEAGGGATRLTAGAAALATVAAAATWGEFAASGVAALGSWA